jgi:hypothetical protein
MRSKRPRVGFSISLVAHYTIPDIDAGFVISMLNTSMLESSTNQICLKLKVYYIAKNRRIQML